MRYTEISNEDIRSSMSEEMRYCIFFMYIVNGEAKGREWRGPSLSLFTNVKVKHENFNTLARL